MRGASAILRSSAVPVTGNASREHVRRAGAHRELRYPQLASAAVAVEHVPIGVPELCPIAVPERARQGSGFCGQHVAGCRPWLGICRQHVAGRRPGPEILDIMWQCRPCALGTPMGRPLWDCYGTPKGTCSTSPPRPMPDAALGLLLGRCSGGRLWGRCSTSPLRPMPDADIEVSVRRRPRASRHCACRRWRSHIRP
jgi:hypothetical protein